MNYIAEIAKAEEEFIDARMKLDNLKHEHLTRILNSGWWDNMYQAIFGFVFTKGEGDDLKAGWVTPSTHSTGDLHVTPYSVVDLENNIKTRKWNLIQEATK